MLHQSSIISYAKISGEVWLMYFHLQNVIADTTKQTDHTLL